MVLFVGVETIAKIVSYVPGIVAGGSTGRQTIATNKKGKEGKQE